MPIEINFYLGKKIINFSQNKNANCEISGFSRSVEALVFWNVTCSRFAVSGEPIFPILVGMLDPRRGDR